MEKTKYEIMYLIGTIFRTLCGSCLSLPTLGPPTTPAIALSSPSSAPPPSSLPAPSSHQPLWRRGSPNQPQLPVNPLGVVSLFHFENPIQKRFSIFSIGNTLVFVWLGYLWIWDRFQAIGIPTMRWGMRLPNSQRAKMHNCAFSFLVYTCTSVYFLL